MERLVKNVIDGLRNAQAANKALRDYIDLLKIDGCACITKSQLKNIRQIYVNQGSHLEADLWAMAEGKRKEIQLTPSYKLFFAFSIAEIKPNRLSNEVLLTATEEIRCGAGVELQFASAIKELRGVCKMESKVI